MLPVDVSIECLDEGQGIEQTLKDHKAAWHKTCRDLFNNTKLQRAKKPSLHDEQTDEDLPAQETRGSPVKARRSNCTLGETLAKNECIFCDKPDKLSNLRLASTLEIDRKVIEGMCYSFERRKTHSQVVKS
jgi:hypothetical protein